MRIVRFKAGNKSGYGILKNNKVQRLTKSPFVGDFDVSNLSFADEFFPLEQIQLLAPCLPSKVVCLGVNYRPHAQEMGSSLPGQPLIFLKPPTAVIGPEESIVLPRDWKRVDY